MVWFPRARWQRWHVAGLCLGVLCVWGAWWVVDYVQAKRLEIHRGWCRGKLKWEVLGAANYAQTHGRLPALISRQGDSSVEQSWRVHLAQFLEPWLMPDYDWEAAWNAPQNLAVADRVDEYGLFRVRLPRSRSRGPGFAQILAIDAPGSPWGQPYDPARAGIHLLALVPESDVRTFEPRDLTLDDLRKLAATPRDHPLPILVVGLDTLIRELSLSDLDLLDAARVAALPADD
jgi:hypothetical protein